MLQGNDLQRISPSSGALSAEHYQTYEMAKENDTVLGGDSIAQIRSYAAYARAQAQAIHKTIAATSGIDDVAAIKAEAVETEQTFAKVGIYADQRIGEILRELPTRQGKRTDTTLVTSATEVTKRQAEQDAGLSHKTAIDLQAMAANPDVVQAVLDKAEQDGTIPSRSQVLKAIRERDAAQRARDAANDALAESERANALKDTEIYSLRRQMAERPKPEIIEREVVPDDYEATKKRVNDLKRDNDRLNREYQEILQQKRESDRMLNQANEMLGERAKASEVQRDIEQFIDATNSFVRTYAGRALAADQLDCVDEATRAEFHKAMTNLAAFSQNLLRMAQEN